MAISCVVTEKMIRNVGDTSYSAPINQLPRNHATPKAVSNIPKPVLLPDFGTIPLTAAFIILSCAPIPVPHSNTPMIKAHVEFIPKTNIANKALINVDIMSIFNPYLSYNPPKNNAATASTAIAPA